MIVSYWDDKEYAYADRYEGYKFVTNNKYPSFLIKTSGGVDVDCFKNDDNNTGRHITYILDGVRYYAQICGNSIMSNTLSDQENDSVNF